MSINSDYIQITNNQVTRSKSKKNVQIYKLRYSTFSINFSSLWKSRILAVQQTLISSFIFSLPMQKTVNLICLQSIHDIKDLFPTLIKIGY